MKRLTLALLILSAIISLACTTSIAENNQWKGTYIYETDNQYTLTFEENTCRIDFGGNMIICKCSQETYDTVYVTNSNEFCNVDFFATMEKDKVLVTGNIKLKNAKGKTDSLSLLNLEKAVFTVRPPFDLSQIAGTRWSVYKLIKKDASPPFDYGCEMIFEDDGNGSIGDWFTGIESFTYVVENNTVTLTFIKKNIQAVATFENERLILDFGNAAVSFIQR